MYCLFICFKRLKSKNYTVYFSIRVNGMIIIILFFNNALNIKRYVCERSNDEMGYISILCTVANLSLVTFD